MNALSRFIRKELLEIARTWRIWVLPGVLVFFAISGPVLAKLMPELLKTMGTGDTGMVIELPTPTYLDAYGQWIKNLSQIGIFLLLGVSAGIVAGERTSGTAVLVLTKPVPRSGFVVAKYLVHAAMLVVVTAVTTALTWGVTIAVFGDAPAERVFASSAVWLAFALFLLAAEVLCSAAFSTLAALGAGIGGFVALGILASWGPAARYTPAGLLGAPGAVLMDKSPELVWPLLTTALAIPALVWVATRVFARKDI